MNVIDREKVCLLGKQVINLESIAVANLEPRIDDIFAEACQYLLNCSGHIVVVGMGKSGHIANKIAATLASTGTPGFYIHPGDAGHGDLGMITSQDLVLAISNSGTTEEILMLVPVIQRLAIPLITMTGNKNSPLAKKATINLDISVEKEACPLGLAPTSSTTAALAMGDALALALLQSRDFTKHDFAISHPSGRLGKRLSLRIDDLMRTGAAIPKVQATALVSAALLEITSKALGMTTVADQTGALIGIFTDGDLRRTLDKGLDVHTTQVTEVMTKDCKTLPLGTLAYDALTMMERYKITSLIIVDQKQQMVGIVHIHDILLAGVA